MIRQGASAQPWAVTHRQVSEIVDRLVMATSPLCLIAQRCEQACEYGSAEKGDLDIANDLDLLVVEPGLSSRNSKTERLQKALKRDLMPAYLIFAILDLFVERSQMPGIVKCCAHRWLCTP